MKGNLPRNIFIRSGDSEYGVISRSLTPSRGIWTLLFNINNHGLDGYNMEQHSLKRNGPKTRNGVAACSSSPWDPDLWKSCTKRPISWGLQQHRGSGDHRPCPSPTSRRQTARLAGLQSFVSAINATCRPHFIHCFCAEFFLQENFQFILHKSHRYLASRRSAMLFP